MYAAGSALGTEDISSRLLFLADNSIAEIDNVDFKEIKVRLLEIMRRASVMPEECNGLTEACSQCDKKAECKNALILSRNPILMIGSFQENWISKSRTMAPTVLKNQVKSNKKGPAVIPQALRI